MIQFFKDLISGKEDSASVKNFSAVIIVFILLIDDLANLFFGFTIAEFIFFGLLGLVSGIFGVKAYLSSKAIDTKTQLSSQIVDKEPSNESTETVKDILNSNQPRG